MADSKQVAIIIVSVVLGLALIGLLVDMGGADEAAPIFWAPAALLFNPITLIIILIVFLVRRKGGGQQQQQQVVVVTGSNAAQAGGPRLRCPQCSHLSKADARFCGGCGVKFG